MWLDIKALDVPGREARTAKLQQRAIQLLLKDKQFGPALAVLRGLPQPQPGLETALKLVREIGAHPAAQSLE